MPLVIGRLEARPAETRAEGRVIHDTEDRELAGLPGRLDASLRPRVRPFQRHGESPLQRFDDRHGHSRL